MKYFPIGFVIITAIITQNPIISGIVFISSAAAYYYAPKIILGLFVILLSGLVFAFTQSFIIFGIMIISTVLGVYFIHRYHQNMASQAQYDKFDRNLKLYAVTPIYILFFAMMVLGPVGLKVSDITSEIVKQNEFQRETKQHSVTAETESSSTSNSETELWEPKSQKDLNTILFLEGDEFDVKLSKAALNLCYDMKKTRGEYFNPYEKVRYYNDEACRLGVYYSMWKRGGLKDAN
jgi:hypothetical protein